MAPGGALRPTAPRTLRYPTGTALTPRMDGIRTLVESGETLAGLVAGSVALAATLVGLRWWTARTIVPDESRRPTSAGGTIPPGIVGPLLAGATLVAIGGIGPLARAGDVPVAVAVGIVALLIGGEVGARVGGAWGPWLSALLALAGGGLLATAVHAPAWAIVLLVVAPGLAGVAVADCDERGAKAGVGPLLALIALAGMYGTVPDTELVRSSLGAALPLMLLAWPRARARLGRGGSYAFAGLFLWIAAVEGAGRAGSIVGATACLGLLVLEPIAVRLRRERARWSLPLLVGGQVLLAVYFARVAGFAQRASIALLLAVPVALGAVGLLVLVNGRARRADPAAPRHPAPPP